QAATAFLDAQGTAHLTAILFDAGSTDNCGISSLLVLPAIVHGAGEHAVQLIAIDGSGNQDTCNTMVTVLDTLAPMAICRDTILYIGTSGTVEVLASELDGGSWDNDGIANWSLGQTVYGCTDIGVNTGTLVVTDSSGNSASCASQITVIDPFPVDAGVDSTANYCMGSASGPLLPWLGTGAQGGGSWTLNGQPVSGMFDPAHDAAGAYVYTVSNATGCHADSAVVTVELHAPPSSYWSPPDAICSSQAAFDMNAFVTGANGGTWAGPGMAPGSSFFDPGSVDAEDGPTSIELTYTVGQSTCSSSSAGTVEVWSASAADAGP